MSSSSGDLFGLRVVVTRAAHQSGGLSDLLEGRGAEVIEAPVIEIAEPDDFGPLDEALGAVDRYDAVLIGSTNAVTAAGKRGFAIDKPIVAVGKKTKAELARTPEVYRGPILLPEAANAEGMVDLIRSRFHPIPGRRFLFLRAPEGREAAIDLLSKEGAYVDAVVAYRVRHRTLDAERLASLERGDVFTFMSGETLAAFLEVVPEARRLLERGRVAVIGPIAKASAIAARVRVDVVPDETTAEALVLAIARDRLSRAGTV